MSWSENELTMSKLRPYQNEALEAIKNRTVQRGVVALPTGTGKGHIAGHITEVLNTKKILYLAHRSELIDQLADHVERVLGFGMVEIEQADNKSYGCTPSVIASVPTLTAMNCKRLNKFKPGRFDAIVVDEAHHSTAESYLKIWQHFGLLDEHNRKTEKPPIPLIGLTATPGRGDGVGLNNVFDEILYRMSLQQAIEQGWLVPIYAWTVQTKTSLDGVKTRLGDYAEGELAKAVATDDRTQIILEAYQGHANGLKSLIFCVNIEHSIQVADYFNGHGIQAKHVAGNMKKEEREGVLKWFQNTPGAVLTNCQLVTEGVDIPSVECVIMARPTKSKTLYAQCLGRGTRLARGSANYQESVQNGKDRLILLDIVDQTKDVGRRAVNISDIFGAPLPTKPLKGSEMVSEVAVQQQQVENAKQGRFAGIEATQVNLFAMAAAIPGAAMAWQDFGDLYRLSLANHGEISIQSDTLDRWSAAYRAQDSKRDSIVIDGISSRDEIVSRAERWVRENHSDVTTLVDATAKWRKDPPSPAQINMCYKLRIPVQAGMTKGQISMLIDRAISSKKQRQFC
jgi:ATP-dependent helicase IRC3